MEHRDRQQSSSSSKAATGHDTSQDMQADEDEEEDENSKDRLLGGPQVAYDGLTIITSYCRTGVLSQGKIIYKYFRTLLKHWEIDLRNRSDHEKNTAKGKTDTRTQKQVQFSSAWCGIG